MHIYIPAHHQLPFGIRIYIKLGRNMFHVHKTYILTVLFQEIPDFANTCNCSKSPQ